MKTLFGLVMLFAIALPLSGATIIFTGVVPQEICTIDKLDDAQIINSTVSHICKNYNNTKVSLLRKEDSGIQNDIIHLEIN